MASIPTGNTNLGELLQHMQPVLHDDTYVFACVAPEELDKIPRELTIGEFREVEGITVILAKEEAIRLQLSYQYEAAWITLNVHSSLAAVGLTAAFSTELAKHGISCNVVAGYYHDHLFVDKAQAATAIEKLRNLSEQQRHQ